VRLRRARLRLEGVGVDAYVVLRDDAVAHGVEGDLGDVLAGPGEGHRATSRCSGPTDASRQARSMATSETTCVWKRASIAMSE
jgi:hypothetical protein